jgi:branched-chain amino acid transport system permease protein
VLYAQVHSIVQSTIFGFDQSVALITMVIVGGVASRWGAFAGALVAQYVAVYPQSIAQYRFLLYGGLVALLMIVLPGGFASVGRALAGARGALVRTRV